MTKIEKIRELRNRTNVSLNECKKALEESRGDIEQAIVVLKKEGHIRAAKMSANETHEGMLFTYCHHDNKQACMLEVNCQTDFAANTEQFKEFCENLCLQIIGAEPQWLTSADVPENVTNVQREIFESQVPANAPNDKRPHIVNQKMKKWFSEVCLMDQKSIVVSGKTVEMLREELVQQIRENVVVKRFVHWKLGQS